MHASHKSSNLPLFCWDPKINNNGLHQKSHENQQKTSSTPLSWRRTPPMISTSNMRNAGLRTKIPFFVRRLPLTFKTQVKCDDTLLNWGRQDLKKLICCWKMGLAKTCEIQGSVYFGSCSTSSCSGFSTYIQVLQPATFAT